MPITTLCSLLLEIRCSLYSHYIDLYARHWEVCGSIQVGKESRMNQGVRTSPYIDEIMLAETAFDIHGFLKLLQVITSHVTTDKIIAYILTTSI